MEYLLLLRQGGNNAPATAGSSSAPADGSVENAVGKNYNDYDGEAHTFRGDEAYKAKWHKIVLGTHSYKKALNKENVIGLIDEYKKSGRDGGIIEYLSTCGVYEAGKDVANRVVKAVMRKALELRLESCKEYQTLATFYGALGTPAYKEDGVTPNNKDTFKFTEQTGEEQFTDAEAQFVDRMLMELVEKIRTLDKESGSN